MNPAPEGKVALDWTFATRAAARTPLHKRRRRGGRWRITSPPAAPWPPWGVGNPSTAASQQPRSSGGASVSIMCTAGEGGAS